MLTLDFRVSCGTVEAADHILKYEQFAITMEQLREIKNITNGKSEIAKELAAERNC